MVIGGLQLLDALGATVRDGVILQQPSFEACEIKGE